MMDWKKRRKVIIGRLFTMNGRRNRSSFLIVIFSLKVLFYMSYVISREFMPQIGFLSLFTWLQSLLNVSFFDFLPYALLAGLVFFTFLIRLYLSLIVQRLHDIGLSGLYILLLFLPMINLIFLVSLALLPGSKKRNRFGPVPAKFDFITE